MPFPHSLLNLNQQFSPTSSSKALNKPTSPSPASTPSQGFLPHSLRSIPDSQHFHRNPQSPNTHSLLQPNPNPIPSSSSFLPLPPSSLSLLPPYPSFFPIPPSHLPVDHRIYPRAILATPPIQPHHSPFPTHSLPPPPTLPFLPFPSSPKKPPPIPTKKGKSSHLILSHHPLHRKTKPTNQTRITPPPHSPSHL